MLKIEIAKPCDMAWADMEGDERVRHCGACEKNVFNISAMIEKEVMALIRRTEGHFCARVYRRADGRVLTADCPRGVAATRRRRALAVTASLALSAVMLAPGCIMGSTGSRANPVWSGTSWTATDLRQTGPDSTVASRRSVFPSWNYFLVGDLGYFRFSHDKPIP